MRDTRKDLAYFESLIDSYETSFENRILKLENNKIASDRIDIVKRSMSSNNLNKLIAKYSSGYQILDLKKDYLVCVNLIEESWCDGFYLVNDSQQYNLTGYTEMLWMLSLGYLLDIENLYFDKLVSVIRQDRVQDVLFEFIISAKHGNPYSKIEESYNEYFAIPKSFYFLRKSLEETSIDNRSILIKDFLNDHWYQIYSDMGWFESHKKDYINYFGYWSFESAAIVKALGLQQDFFKDSKYFPYW